MAPVDAMRRREMIECLEGRFGQRTVTNWLPTAGDGKTGTRPPPPSLTPSSPTLFTTLAASSHAACQGRGRDSTVNGHQNELPASGGKRSRFARKTSLRSDSMSHRASNALPLGLSPG